MQDACMGSHEESGAAEHDNGRGDFLFLLDQLRLQQFGSEPHRPELVPREGVRVLVSATIGR